MNDRKVKNVVVIGANSLIAHETARIYAKSGCNFFLAGRNTEKLDAVRQDLTARGAGKIEIHSYDAENYEDISLVECSIKYLGKIDLVLIAHGVLCEQESLEEAVKDIDKVFHINFFSYAYLLLAYRKALREKDYDTVLAAISSVAGDRGRQSNYIYGTTKAALSSFLSGLRNSLSGSNIHVLTIKPGFVSTPMTIDFRQNRLYAEASEVAKGIVQAVNNRKDVVYLPFFWRYIMLIIRQIPEFIFKKLSL